MTFIKQFFCVEGVKQGWADKEVFDGKYILIHSIVGTLEKTEFFDFPVAVFLNVKKTSAL